MENQEKIRRFIPCSLYCTAKIESWLEEMAADGYILYKFSKFDYAVFTKDKPQKNHYRLCLKGKYKDESEMQNLMRKYGWERICEIKNLIVFSSQNPIPFEADDKFKLIELRDKAVKHRSKQNLISVISPLLIIASYILFKDVAIDAVKFGIGALLTPISIIFFLIAWQIVEIIDINTYKKHISDKNSYIKNTGKINLVLSAAKYISVAAIFLSFIILLISPSTEASSDIWYSNSDKSENPPFATVEDFVTGNATKKGNPETDPGAMYNKWSNAVSKLNYFWQEEYDYLHSDGTTERIQILVSYHKASNPILAKHLIWDYYWKDKTTKIRSDVKKISGYDIDYGITYRNWNFLVVIAQKGNTVIKAEFESVRLTEEEPFEVIESITDEEAIEIICSNFQK